MTTKPRAKLDEPPAEQPNAEAEAPRCGKPHSLPLLADRITCSEPAQESDSPLVTPEHQHRHEDGDTVYVWS